MTDTADKPRGASSGRRPGWMSIPGGPKEPNRNDFRTKLQKLNTEKSDCLNRLKEIRSKFYGDDDDREAVEKERGELRQRLNEIDALRQKQREMRRFKDTEIAAARKKRDELDALLHELSGELGAFHELDEIEAAIDRVMFKMETGASGSLANEKKVLKRMQKLEEAKALILQIGPLHEALQEAEERESELQSEYREIHDRISTLNSEYASSVEKKREHDQATKKQGFDRSALVKERDATRARIGKINEEANAIRKAFDEAQQAWNEWREHAQQIYKKQMEEQWRERERRIAEREAERKNVRKRERAMRRLNPYANEIDCCATLIRYLEEKVHAHKQRKEDEAHRKKLAAFDPTASAPSGAVLSQIEDDWLFQDRTKVKPAKAKPSKAATESQPKPQKEDKPKDRFLQHTVDRFKSFELVKVEVPLTLGQVPAALEALKTKKKEYESHIKEGDLVLSEGEDKEEEEEEATAAPEAPAQETA